MPNPLTQRLWDPTAYLHATKNPELALAALNRIEDWRLKTRIEVRGEPGGPEAVDLEAHFRQLIASFLYAEPSGSYPGDLTILLTALGNVAGLVAIDAINAGADRGHIMDQIGTRIRDMIDAEPGMGADAR